MDRTQDVPQGADHIRGAAFSSSQAMLSNAILRNLFGIDPRSLSLFRMAMGALLLTDLAIRVGDLSEMYTDSGMFPREVIARHYTTVWNWSFHFGSGSWAFQATMFAVAAGLSLALLLGYETRLAAVGSWLMLLSLHNRVPPIQSGADNLLRMLLFWAMFLPLESKWSLDTWLDKRRADSPPKANSGNTPVLSIASAAILLQMGLMYLFTAIFKTNSDWLQGRALVGILAHDFYAAPASAWFLQYPQLLTGLTYGTFILEWASPFLLFVPKYTGPIRLAVVAALALLHVGIDLCLAIGLFSLVSLAGLTLFLPAEFWNSRLFARFTRSDVASDQLVDESQERATQRTPLFLASQGVCLVLLIFVVVLNINGLPSRPLALLSPEKWRPLTISCGLGQKWNMFENVPSKDGWYVAKAKLADNSEVDLLRQGAPVDWRRPSFPAVNYPNHFWQKVFREMAYEDEFGYHVFRTPIAEYLCREWNSKANTAKQIVEFEFIYCTELEAAESSSLRPISREKLLHLDVKRP